MKTIYTGEYNYSLEAYHVLCLIGEGDKPNATAKINEILTSDEMEKMFYPATRLYEAVSESIDVTDERFSVLFSSEKDMNKIAEIYLYELFTLEHYEDYKPAPKDGKLKQFSRIFDTPEFYCDEKFHSYVFSLNIGELSKYRVIYAFHNYEELSGYFVELVKKVIETVREVINQISPIDFDRNAIKNMVEGDFLTNLKKIAPINLEEDGNYFIYPCVSGFNGMTLLGEFDTSDFFVMVGTHVLALLEKSSQNFGSERMLSFLKALSDKTKFEIIQMLKDETMYGTQIAEKLALTTATISYHISSLASLGIIVLKKENNRIYYSLNKDTFARYADELKRMVM